VTGIDYWHKAWSCPYFRWDDKQAVGCEGGKVKFPDKKSAAGYMGAYCASACGEWGRCGIAAMLTEFYEQEEKKGK